MDIRDAFSNGINGPGDVKSDAAWHRPRHLAKAQDPIHRVERARVDPHTNLVRSRIGNGRILQAQHVGPFAVGMEADRLHGCGL